MTRGRDRLFPGQSYRPLTLTHADFIARYDRPGTLFYLDPPYWGCESDYGAALFERDDFERLEKALSGLSRAFILSLNDVPEVRQLFARHRVTPVKTTYTIRGGSRSSQSAREVIISNR